MADHILTDELPVLDLQRLLAGGPRPQASGDQARSLATGSRRHDGRRSSVRWRGRIHETCRLNHV